jgi:hypothetical protein
MGIQPRAGFPSCSLAAVERGRQVISSQIQGDSPGAARVNYGSDASNRAMRALRAGQIRLSAHLPRRGIGAASAGRVVTVHALKTYRAGQPRASIPG